MSYRILGQLIIVFLVVYFSVGIAARFLSRGTEDFYPFFSWFLFTTVPPRIQTDYAIRIVEAGGKKFDPPVFFERADDVYEKGDRSVAEYSRLTRSLAMSVRGNQKEEVERLRSALERKFLVYPVVYEAVEVTFSPIERWKTGEVLGVKTLATFAAQTPPPK